MNARPARGVGEGVGAASREVPAGGVAPRRSCAAGRTVIAPAQVPAGLVTALIGGPRSVWRA